MSWFELLGFIAGIFTVGSALPQIIKILITGKARDVSTYTYTMLTIGCVLWTAYGISLRSFSLILWNIISTILSSTILVLRWKFK